LIKGLFVPKPGGRVRQLARDRKNEALLRFFGVFILVFAPLLILWQMPKALGLGLLILIACWVGAGVLWQQGQKLLIRAKQANQGALGEEQIAELLGTLEKQGWEITYNLRLKRWGDADAFLRSPKSNYFVVDVKSHKAGVFFDGTMLKRRYGKQVREFDRNKDFLKDMMGQASTLEEMKGVVVQPIICFTQARLEKINWQKPINSVYVVQANNLLGLLDFLEEKGVGSGN
jgi:Holliday junction resolvase-like predicted endonuclease